MREVNDFACNTISRREPLAALPGTDVWRYAWSDGAHCPCAACHAANDKKNPMAFPDQAHLFQRGGWQHHHHQHHHHHHRDNAQISFKPNSHFS
jgi:hypothetical protein